MYVQHLVFENGRGRSGLELASHDHHDDRKRHSLSRWATSDPVQQGCLAGAPGPNKHYQVHGESGGIHRQCEVRGLDHGSLGILDCTAGKASETCPEFLGADGGPR